MSFLLHFEGTLGRGSAIHIPHSTLALVEGLTSLPVGRGQLDVALPTSE